MPDKPQTAADAFFTLPDHRIVTLSGRDATAFAQAQFMNDVVTLAPGHWQWNGWLTPKGRLIALFALLKFDAETLWLLLPDTPAADFTQPLQRFVFRSKVTVASREDLRVAGAFAASALSSGNHFNGEADAVIELDLSGEGGGRTLRIGAALDAAQDGGAMARWRAADLMHGLPRLDTEQSGEWTPQQLSLDRLNAYSVKKGCYPGQEIVARTHFLGQAKRGLALFEADRPVVPGSELRGGNGANGTVISVAATDETHALLAVVPLEHALTDAGIDDDIRLRRMPLMGGLIR